MGVQILGRQETDPAAGVRGPEKEVRDRRQRWIDKEEADMEIKKDTTSVTLSRDAIAQLAYTIWEREGRPEGRAAEHWQQAENQLRQQTRPVAPATPAVNETATQWQASVTPATRNGKKARRLQAAA